MRPVCDPAIGEWVHASEVWPLANIAGRRYMTADGIEGTFYGQAIGTTDVYWFFPAKAQEPEPVKRTLWHRIRKAWGGKA